MKTAYRQGDVPLFKVEKRPELGHRITDGVLAYGKATGHPHRMAGDYIVMTEAEYDPYGWQNVPD